MSRQDALIAFEAGLLRQRYNDDDEKSTKGIKYQASANAIKPLGRNVVEKGKVLGAARCKVWAKWLDHARGFYILEF